MSRGGSHLRGGQPAAGQGRRRRQQQKPSRPSDWVHGAVGRPPACRGGCGRLGGAVRRTARPGVEREREEEGAEGRLPRRADGCGRRRARLPASASRTSPTVLCAPVLRCHPHAPDRRRWCPPCCSLRSEDGDRGRRRTALTGGGCGRRRRWECSRTATGGDSKVNRRWGLNADGGSDGGGGHGGGGRSASQRNPSARVLPFFCSIRVGVGDRESTGWVGDMER